jgi:hypothetical protein
MSPTHDRLVDRVSVMGAVMARSLPVPIEEFSGWAKTVSYRAILGPEQLHRRHGLTGMFVAALRPVRARAVHP